jgi:hypothetical protein
MELPELSRLRLCHSRIVAQNGPVAILVKQDYTGCVTGLDPISKVSTMVNRISRFIQGDGEKPKKLKLIKVVCSECGAWWRTSQKFIDRGLPTCTCGGQMKVAPGQK